MGHIPVLLKEVIESLNPVPGQFFIDGTLGNGGHGREIIKRITPGGIFLGIDWDKSAIANFKIETFGSESRVSDIVLENNNFKNLSEILERKRLPKADGLLLDLGFSSEQIEGRGNLGFSFRRDEPLRMVYDSNQKPLNKILIVLEEKELVEVIKKFSGERYATRIAQAIKKSLPIETSGRLAEIIRGALPKNYEKGRIDPATRTFLALRIFANKELENLETTLFVLPKIVKKGGRVAVISYNSLEDKIVKTVFKDFCKRKIAVAITKKPVVSTNNEIRSNPRARSAKLRAIKLE